MDNDFQLTLVICFLVFISFFLGMYESMCSYVTAIDNAGIVFCDSYGLEFDKFEISGKLDGNDHILRFVCTNDTKIDAIGILRVSED